MHSLFAQPLTRTPSEFCLKIDISVTHKYLYPVISGEYMGLRGSVNKRHPVIACGFRLTVRLGPGVWRLSVRAIKVPRHSFQLQRAPSVQPATDFKNATDDIAPFNTSNKKCVRVHQHVMPTI